jgi:hypothetical protein
MDDILKTPVAVLVVSIFAILGVFFVAIAIIGKIPRIQLTGKGALSSVEIEGKRAYVLALFGIGLIAGAAGLASFSPPAEIAKVREELLATIAAQGTKIAKPTSTPRIEQITVTKEIIVTRVVEPTPLATLPVGPTPLATLTADPLTLETMDELSNWSPSFCDQECGGVHGPSALIVSSVPGRGNNAVEVIYDLKPSGWVLITKNIDPNADLKILSKTSGLSFWYKSSSASTRIELKFLLRYPGDTEDTAFGASWKTLGSDSWIRLEARYDGDFGCWWPEALCQRHGNVLEFTAIKRIDLAVANIGETASLGKVIFDDLVGIPP